jgi:hypothetical protein
MLWPCLAWAQSTDDESELRSNMWKLWKSTVTAPSDEGSDPADSPPQGQNRRPDASDQAQDPTNRQEWETLSTDPPASPGRDELEQIEPIREQLIPVQLPTASKPEMATTPKSKPDASEDSNAAKPEDTSEPQQTQPAKPESKPAGPPPVRVAQNPVQKDPKDPIEQETPEKPALVDPLLDEANEMVVPPALVAALKLAQVSSADKVKDPAALADRLYRQRLYRPAEFFYRAALVRQKDIDRAWVLMQLGNCLQHRDYATAGETYATILAEFPKSPWAKLARVQKEICQFRLRHRGDETIEEVLKLVNQPEDPIEQLLQETPEEASRE